MGIKWKFSHFHDSSGMRLPVMTRDCAETKQIAFKRLIIHQEKRLMCTHLSKRFGQMLNETDTQGAKLFFRLKKDSFSSNSNSITVFKNMIK